MRGKNSVSNDFSTPIEATNHLVLTEINNILIQLTSNINNISIKLKNKSSNNYKKKFSLKRIIKSIENNDNF